MFFQHYKGNFYQVLQFVTNATTDELMVLYIPLYQCQSPIYTALETTPSIPSIELSVIHHYALKQIQPLFVRTYMEFMGYVEKEGRNYKRFVQVSADDIPQKIRKYIQNSTSLSQYF